MTGLFHSTYVLSLCGVLLTAVQLYTPADVKRGSDESKTGMAYHRAADADLDGVIQDSLWENWFGARGDCSVSMPELVRHLDTMDLAAREEYLKELVFNGFTPRFMAGWVPVRAEAQTEDGRTVEAVYYVTPDYLSVGCDDDFFRVPLTPGTAQGIADRFGCFLPTRKMVDDIYRGADVKLQPLPLTEDRERVETFYEHHTLIEAQRNGRSGLIAGIKKDVVISEAVAKSERQNRVAIYGWHKEDGKPVQPLYAGHVDHYVDYSHGIRLVYGQIRMEGMWMHYRDVLGNPDLKRLLCDEATCDFFAYD